MSTVRDSALYPGRVLPWLAQYLFGALRAPRGRVAPLCGRDNQHFWVRPQGETSATDEPVLIRQSAAADRPCGSTSETNSR